MIAKYWQKVGLIVVVIACLFNIVIKIVSKASVRDELEASALYECILEILTLQGYYNAYACVLSGNDVSKKFHARHGFNVLATIPNIVNKHGKWVDLVWMAKSLQEELVSYPDEPLTIGELDKKVLEDIFLKNKGIIKGI